jgi:hypothetical protein
MTDWYLLLAPIASLAVLLLFRFVGCDGASISDPDPNVYREAIEADAPVAYFRLRENAADTPAKNEMGPPNGTFGLSPFPIPAGDPNWRSTEVAQPSFVLHVTDPKLVQTDFSPDYSSVRFHGGFVEVPANVPPLDSLTEFTLEVLLQPEWDVAFALGKYYCVLESADFIAIAGQPPPQQKNAGFGIYAGPDNPSDLTSPYTWQFWMGVGPDGFERLFPKLPYPQPTGNPVPNPGPTVQPEPTYVAVTFSELQGKAFLHVYTPTRDIDYTTYELNPLPYVKASQQLFIGITPQGPLFPPFLGPTLLYPFQGLIGDIAIYDKVLDEHTLRNHVINAFYNM